MMPGKYLVLGLLAVLLLLTTDLSASETYPGLIAPAGFLITVFTMLVLPGIDHYRRDKKGFVEERERFKKYMEENWDSPSTDDGMD